MSIRTLQDSAIFSTSVDGRCIPATAARRRDAARIEVAAIARRLAGDVGFEYFADDLGLGLHNRQLAGFSGDRTIAMSAPACMSSVASDAIQAAPRMRDKVLKEHFTHERTQCAVEFSDLAACGVNLDAEKIESLASGVSA